MAGRSRPTAAWRCGSRDTGRGIPAGVGNKIFEPGFTTKKRGWGMGLALVKRIVDPVPRRPDPGRPRPDPRGTTFPVTLPAATPF